MTWLLLFWQFTSEARDFEPNAQNQTIESGGYEAYDFGFDLAGDVFAHVRTALFELGKGFTLDLADTLSADIQTSSDFG